MAVLALILKKPVLILIGCQKNQQNVAWYEEHPQTGFIFTNNGFLTLFTLLNDGTKKGWATTIPTELPILVISGDQDPVGGMGKGVRKVFHELEDAQFTDITLCTYPELRHEILMEDSYLLVYQDLLNWLNRHLLYFKGFLKLPS